MTNHKTTAASDFKIANLRRLYLHTLNGGRLSERALARTGGARTAEGISALIRKLETEREVHGN